MSALLAACGSDGLVGDQNAGTVSGLGVTVGEVADSVAWLENHAGHPVVLASAAVLPLSGFRTPKLVDVGVEPAGSTLRGRTTAGATRGWPPSGIRVTGFSGYRLMSGGTLLHHTALIVFGVAAARPGDYAVAGIDVTLRDGSSSKTVRSIGPLAICVHPTHRLAPCPRAFTDRALRASSALVGR